MDAEEKQGVVSVGQYFTAVGILTLILIATWISSQPAIIQTVKEALGLRPYLQAEDDSFYQQRVHDIMARYCIACHTDDKSKGGLRLDSFRQAWFGGKSGSVLSNGEQAILLQRMLLPVDDKLAMPPYGRDRHTDEELAIVTLWLKKGASNSLKEEDFPEAPEKAPVIHFAPIDWAQINNDRQTFAGQVSDFQHRYPFSLNYQSRTTTALIFKAQLVEKGAVATAFESLCGMSPVVAEVYLNNEYGSEWQGDMAFHKHYQTAFTSRQWPELRVLDIRHWQISPALSAFLVSLPKLQRVTFRQGYVGGELVASLEQKGVRVTLIDKEGI